MADGEPRRVERLVAADPESLTDIHRAARWFFILRTNYAGKLGSKSFTPPKGSGERQKKVSLFRVEESLYEVHRRLSDVTIEHLAYAACIERYDGPETVFYLDPPYWGNEEDYGKNVFGRGDFETLAGILRGVKGKFLLSLNDREGVREVFQGFEMREVELTYLSGAWTGKGTKAKELFISNYPMPDVGKAGRRRKRRE